ncbi:hypothetical protein BTH42_26995 [Burkholderia sp. SRS-W-2-2016]|uniref:hypothetical protein n=1 Tax=Burkholderia sp. SRS-W-2-2016 TaxID=1926878 RepID=UPI00094B4937|nr:hypothetical protein [Burkholderia sp. SRS-W-2-2016]OLL28421.1 hypothetical protein BTH42_26995 [Burkholderia sp. SRS-W-2-2016]
MPSKPSAESTGTSADHAQNPGGTTRQPDPKGRQNPAPDDLPDADAAEPVPHEHLPPRSDDN